MERTGTVFPKLSSVAMFPQDLEDHAVNFTKYHSVLVKTPLLKKHEYHPLSG